MRSCSYEDPTETPEPRGGGAIIAGRPSRLEAGNAPIH